ncbi:preprotein translocase [Candidatus Woesebacteria bacterium RIFCSPHIGHO2_01_FULL_39_17]|uniref:Sec-independent protein translocase protein TatA n=2 Tax=Candidatus Woeseibacteriota TaxID=1752722 RepID=A0A0G0P8T0_9BACT|nr:MAG: Sec-independent protein translocase protein TatA [Candidatus Woesebacteria bacterium GW2011_GWB1_39_10b]OGM24321.1 MAG: preprotein translocase [Candidatus Woesebacteria bacterium RIFCSPHIGHO2_01_FULL_39_17]OGM63863.1 MAG: preprotein translocase [Candidatus Woesebacteria bacterium RIFCSPLOWO2_01_FULL_39_14]
MSNIGSPELVVIAVIVLWLFGANKLKELARGLGEGAREFKKIKKEIENPESDENQK